MKNSKPTNFEPYPVYKDSGTPWLGKIPRNWELVPNKAIMELRKSSVGENFDKYTLLSLTKQGVIPRDLEEAKGKFPESFESYQIVEPGDLVFCLFDMDETPRTIGIARQRGMVTGAYTRFACSNKTTGEFAYLLYSSLDDQKALKPLYTGLRKVITKGAFLSARIALPPPDEQAAIVRYLGAAEQQIHAYISAKERLISLLEEQRQAIIHQAVTRGLDPNVRLKPSGVEWLGDVPEHWTATHLRYVTSCLDGSRIPKNAEERGQMQGEIPYWGANRVIDHVNTWIFDEPLVLIGEDGAPFFDPNRNVSFYVCGKIWVNNHVHVLRCGTHVKPEFLSHVLNNVDYTDFISGSTRDKLTQSSMGNIPIQIPPIAEQEAITEDLSYATSIIARAVSQTHRQIELMEEYRTRLIADVVTGKLDVRDAAEELPQLKAAKITG